jgi:hypothetical protein
MFFIKYYILYDKMPVYDYDCGSINERIQSCDNLKTQSTCEPNTGLYWTSDSDGNAKLCE